MALLALVDAPPETWDEVTAADPVAPGAADVESLAPTAIRPPPPGRLPPGAILAGRYQIERHLASGGMGEVYLALDVDLRELVALKTIRPEYASNALAMQRFVREVRQARSVTHPGICRVFDFGRHVCGGTEIVFFTMEHVPGNTLADHLDRQGLSVEAALPLIAQLAAALDAAHRAGVVHCDLKPANILVAGGGGATVSRTVLTDFGLARQANTRTESEGNSLGLGLVGTPDYMAPEQVLGEELTAATDVYALGVVVFEMMTGELPFSGESAMATAVKQVHEKPRCPRSLATQLPAAWAAAILRCLEKAPAARFHSAGEFLAALEATPAAGEDRSRGLVSTIAAALLACANAIGLVDTASARCERAVRVV